MTQKITRRSTLGLIGAAAGLAAIRPLAVAAEEQTNPPPDLEVNLEVNLENRQQLELAFRKLAYSLDNSLTFWWLRGTRYGVVDAVATPFWDMYVGTWFTTRDLDDGSYELTMANVNFYTPPNKTELLEVFQNPYTGEKVPVQYTMPKKPWRTVIGPDGGSAFGGSDIPGMTTTKGHSHGPAFTEGDEVFIRGDMFMYAEPLDAASGTRPLRVNDWSTYVGKLADIVSPAVTNAPAAQYFTDILTWPKWLQMGDQPGSYVSRCAGRKVFAYGQMPQTWRRLLEGSMTEVAQDPGGFLKEK